MDVADHATEGDDDAWAAVQPPSGPSAYRCDLCGDALSRDRAPHDPGTEHCFDCVDALKHINRRGLR